MRLFTARRTAFVVLLLGHALAHTLAGLRITDVFGGRAGTGAALIVATVLWAGASAGSLGAALGLLGSRWFSRHIQLLGNGAHHQRAAESAPALGLAR